MENKTYIILICAIVSIGGFLFGFDAAVISGCNSYITGHFDLTPLQLGTVVSSVTISSALAMLVAGTIADAIGRKPVLIVVAFFYLISAIASATAPSYVAIILARLLGGVAFGAALVLVPLYIAELVPAKMRGSMVSVQQLAIVLGFSAAYFSNYYLLQLSKSGLAFALEYNLIENIWRWMLGVEVIPALLFCITLFFIPRSPRWLVMKGKLQEARNNISKVYGSEQSELIIQDIQQNLEESVGVAKPSVLDSLRSMFKSKYSKIMLVAFTIGIAQMSVGINAVFFYITNIFELTGIGTDASFVQSVWVGIINVLFTLIAIFLIDRVGRRPLLLTGIAGILVSLLVVAYGFSKAEYVLTSTEVAALDLDFNANQLEPMMGKTYGSDVEFVQALKETIGAEATNSNKGTLIKAAGNLNPVLLLFGILGFVACFAFSLGPVMWVLLSEIFPTAIRGIAISVVGFTNSVTSWVVVQFFPWQLDNFGSANTFLIYAVFAALALLILFKILPETKGKTLEELEKQLAV